MKTTINYFRNYAGFYALISLFIFIAFLAIYIFKNGQFN